MRNKNLYLNFVLLYLSLLCFSCSETEKGIDSVSSVKLVESNPVNGATDVNPNISAITLTFDKAVSILSGGNKITLEPETSITNVTNSVRIMTVEIPNLKWGTQYSLTIPKGVLVDNDNNVVDEVKISFTTEALSDEQTPDITGMESDAFALFKKIKVGWNLGNSLDSYNEGLANHMDSETSWGNPKTKKRMIDAVKKAGFNTVRIPVRWYPHVTDQNTMAEIKTEWLNRVKEVVDYCIDNDMYVILNTHHEDWLESHPFESEAETILIKEKFVACYCYIL